MVRSSSRRAALACPALAALMLASSLALAGGVSPDDATPAQKKDAMEHFMTGKHAAESQNWEEAEAELRASLGIIDSPNARLVLSRALRDSGELAKAWAEYAQTIADATKLGEKDERYKQTASAASTERGEIEAKLAFVTVTVEHAPADATLKVGGRVIPQEQWSAPIVVSPGAIDVVVADASGKELARKTVSASVGEKAPVALDTQPPAPVATATTAGTTPSADDVPPKEKAGDSDDATTEAPSSPGGRAKLRPAAYVAGGVGVAGFIVFGVFGAMEKSAYSSLQGACPGNVCPPDKASQISNGKTDELLANVGLGVGIAGLAVGATLFAISLGGSSPAAPPAAASTSLVVSPAFIGLRGAL